MKFRNIKRIIVFAIAFSFVLQGFSYAKDNSNARIEFARPIAESSDKNVSEATIVKKSTMKAYGPLNPTPIGIDKEEYDSVDNYNIDLKTIEKRIKYFAPAYLNIKNSAMSQYYVGLYAVGGSQPNIDEFRNTKVELYQNSNEAKRKMQEASRKLEAYKKTSNPDSSVITELMTAVATYGEYYKLYYQSYMTVDMTLKSLGQRKALAKIADIDSNHQITYARESVTKALTSLVITYKKLDASIKVLEEQEKLYKKIYETYMRNYELGVATSLEVSSKLNDYENAKVAKTTLLSTYKNVKEQLCINLGYSIDDVDKINVVEPEVDFDYILHINIDEDKEKAYNSNSAYQAITLSSKDKKLPGSTGEELFIKRQNSTAEKVIVALESAYNNLQAALFTYDGCEYLKKACEINKNANERKKENNLVSDTEYLGLKIQNLANELQVLNAKYDLISAANDYYYGTIGQLTIE